MDISHEARQTVALWVTICELSGERAVVLSCARSFKAPGDDVLSPFYLVFEQLKPTICLTISAVYELQSDDHDIIFHDAAPHSA